MSMCGSLKNSPFLYLQHRKQYQKNSTPSPNWYQQPALIATMPYTYPTEAPAHSKADHGL
jgi:hypothetical protein